MVNKKISMAAYTLVIQSFGLSILCTFFLFSCSFDCLCAQADSLDYRLGTSEFDVDVDSSFFYYSNEMIDRYVDYAKELYHKYDSIGLSQFNPKPIFFRFSIPSQICLLDAVNKYYGDRILGDYLSIFPEQKGNFYLLLSDRIICPSMWDRRKFFRSFLENHLVENDPYYFELITIYDLENLVNKKTFDTLTQDLDKLKSKIVLGEAFNEDELNALKSLALQARFGSEEVQDAFVNFIRGLSDRVSILQDQKLNVWYSQYIIKNIMPILNSKSLYQKLGFLARDSDFQEEYFLNLLKKMHGSVKNSNVGDFRFKYLTSDKQDGILPDSTVQELLEMMEHRDDIWYPFVKLN